MIASSVGHKEICELLIEKDADIEYCKEKVPDETYSMFQTMKSNYESFVKTRNISRCQAVKEDLMIYVWNPEREYTKWSLLSDLD